MCLLVAAAPAAQSAQGTVTLMGTVCDVLGTPIPAAAVEVVLPVTQSPTRRTATDASGRWLIARVDGEEPALVRAHARGHAIVELRWPPPLTERADSPLHFTLPDGELVSGRVRDAQGNGLAGVIVSAGAGIEATTDAGGSYGLTVAMGTTRLFAWGNGFVGARATVQVSAPCTQDFVLAADTDPTPSAVLAVRRDTEPDEAAAPVLIETTFAGQPALPDALRFSRPDGAGRVELRGLPKGFVHVDLHDQSGWQRTRANATIPLVRVDLRLPRSRSKEPLRGRVVDLSGNGVPGLTLVIDRRERIVTDATGRFASLLAIDEAQIPVAVVSDEWILRSPSGALRDPNAGGRIFPQVIPAVRLRGRVLDGDEQPVAFARVCLVPVQQWPNWPANGFTSHTDAEGRFVLGGIAQGPTAAPCSSSPRKVLSPHRSRWPRRVKTRS
jgi:hypothetical protein